MSYEVITFDVLKGQTAAAVEQRARDSLVFVLQGGDEYEFYHDQDCCEDVSIEDINGDLSDLVGAPILMAEEVTYDNKQPELATAADIERVKNADDSYTWTYYKFATIKGYVTVRWFGSSNGYYSERVDFRKIK